MTQPICVLRACSVVSYSETPWAAARQAPLSMGFSRQEYWYGLPFPSLGICICVFTDYIHIHTHSYYFQKVFQEYYKKRHIQTCTQVG